MRHERCATNYPARGARDIRSIDAKRTIRINLSLWEERHMTRFIFTRAALPLAASLLLVACADSTAPAIRPLPTSSAASIVGGPNLSDFRSFTGQLWACPDTPSPASGFFFSWKIVDNATSAVVASGTVSNAAAQQCLMFATVPTNVPGRYTATVREDPGSTFQVTSITADYGANFPVTPPVPTVNVAKRVISSLMTHDFGVMFTFHH